MKTNKLITRCPINEELIKKIIFTKCEYYNEGDFHLSKYNYLDDELYYGNIY